MMANDNHLAGFATEAFVKSVNMSMHEVSATMQI